MLVEHSDVAVIVIEQVGGGFIVDGGGRLVGGGGRSLLWGHQWRTVTVGACCRLGPLALVNPSDVAPASCPFCGCQ